MIIRTGRIGGDECISRRCVDQERLVEAGLDSRSGLDAGIFGERYPYRPNLFEEFVDRFRLQATMPQRSIESARRRSLPSAICVLRSLMRSCSRGIAQTRVVAGAGPSVGLRATMIDGKTSASSKICLAWPKSTTDSTQASSAKNRRSGSP